MTDATNSSEHASDAAAAPPGRGGVVFLRLRLVRVRLLATSRKHYNIAAAKYKRRNG